MKTLLKTYTTFLVTLLILSITSFNAHAALDYCWKNTYGRGVGTIPPGRCAANQEMQGTPPFFTCYDKCPRGYDSTALGGCMQACPKDTNRDDFGNCVDSGAKKRYKNIEFTYVRNPDKCTIFEGEGCLWNSCRKRHGQKGCEKYGAAIVAKCDPGFKRATLHCIPDLNCDGYVGKGVDFFGKTFCETKRKAPRAPRPADCGSGKVNDAGLCYNKCGAGYDGAGPVCWAKCPKIRGKQWVECGAGCAADSVACGLNTSDMVVSVLDSALSIATIGSGSLVKGARAAVQKGATSGIKEAAKKGGKTFATTFVKSYKDVIKGGTKTALSVAGGAQDIQTAQSSVRGVKAFAEGVQEIVGQNISQEEMDFQIAQIALGTASLLDPSGVLGVVAAYTKPLCSVLIAGGESAPGDSTPDQTAGAAEVLAADTAALLEINTMQLASVQQELSGLKSGSTPFIPVSGSTQATAPAVVDQMKRQKITALENEVNERQQIINNIKKSGTTSSTTQKTTKPPKGSTGSTGSSSIQWEQVPGAAVDVGTSDGKTAVWVTNKADHIYSFSNNKWLKQPGAAQRISVSYYGNPWVVNKTGQVWRWSNNKWVSVPGLNATDIAVSKKIWAISNVKTAGGYTIHEYDDSKKTWIKRPGGAVRIAVSQWGNPWVVNSAGQVWRWSNGTFQLVPGINATDIGIGANAHVWVTTDKQEIYFTEDGKQWKKSTGGAVTIDAGIDGTPWVINSAQQIWRKK